MPTLLETIRQNMQSAAAGAAQPTAANQVNTTGQAQTLMQARSGKAVAAGTTPRISNVGEQLAQQQAQLGQQQLAQQVAQGTQQLKTQEEQQAQKIQLQEQEQKFEAGKVETDFSRNADALMNQYIQGQKQLNLNKDKANFEQIGFNLRQQNQQYMDNLRREAQKSQLDNALRFKEEMARTVFSEEMGMFQDNLDFRSSLFSDKQAFNDKMAQMDLDYAVQMAEFDAKQASANSLYTGIGTLVSGGAQAYAAYDKKHPSTSSASAEGGADTGLTADNAAPGGMES